MYGLVNQAIEQLVCKDFGEETWQRIKEAAQVENEAFISNQSYPDSITYDLAIAASKTLEVPLDDVLRSLGKHWVLVTAPQGYGELMDMAGENLVDFLTYLPNFHTRVQLLFPKLKPPSFEIDNVQENQLHLHYFSERQGLQSFLVGLVEGLGIRFNTPATCKYLRGREEGEDHDIFLVEWQSGT